MSLANRDLGKVHLDPRLLDRTLAPPIALDDRRLEGLAGEAWESSAGLRRP
jgi:hypothetical protein